MDEDEQEDLLVHVSDSDDSPEESDAYLDVGSRVIPCPPFRHGLGGRCCFKKRVEFLCTGFVCLLSATALLILLPLYLESSSQIADIYPSLLFSSATSAAVIISCICLRAKFRIFSLTSFQKNVMPPFPMWRVLQIGSIHGLGGIFVLYALDRQRVLCHLQDPLKGVVLIISMVYYFCFSRKIMGLQKIFCATTIIIGLFVSVDYALCDEFHCRGYERKKVEDDAGNWSHSTHFLWGVNYMCGLALWCLHFSLLEGQIVALRLENQLACTSQPSLLETISCMISSQDNGASPSVISSSQTESHWDTNQPLLTSNEQQAAPNNESSDLSRRNVDRAKLTLRDSSSMQSVSQNRNNLENLRDNYPSALNIVFWVYSISFMVILLFFWTGMIPSIGKGASWSDFLNNTHVGILCHFQSPDVQNGSCSLVNVTTPSSLTSNDCGCLAQYGWLFTASLLVFSTSAYHFLILCQSSVFTIALTTSALPVANIFWSLFRLVPFNGGFIQWWPNFTPELVCTLLGIPIICTGLVLLCKAHWINTTQKELCCTLRYHPRPSIT